MLHKFSLLVCAAVMALSANTASAVPITIDFDTISLSANYAEDGFSFNATGNHTDLGTSLFWHDGGANPGDNDIILTFGGNPFSILSLDIFSFSNFSIVTSAGTFTAAATGTSIPVNLLNITTATFETIGNTNIDNLVLDNQAVAVAVAEPGPLALLGFGLTALGATAMRRRRSV